MEPEPTAIEPSMSKAEGLAHEPDPFGTRRSSGRPHSMSLFRSSPAPLNGGGVSRRVDLLLGIGLGAAAMYYLDPDHGAARRALLWDKVAHTLARLGERRRGVRGVQVGRATRLGFLARSSEVSNEPTAR
jgi:hypothetical protein